MEIYPKFVELWEGELDKSDDLWVMGDFNLDLKKIGKNPHHRYGSFLGLIEDKILSRGVSQLISQPTWFDRKGNGGMSCIDHVYTSSENYRSPTAVNCGSSDHHMVSVVLVNRGKLLREQHRMVRSFKNFNYDDFNYTLGNLRLDDICAEPDPDHQIMRLTAALNVAADIHCPLSVRTEKKIHTKWMNESLRARIGLRDRMFDEYKREAQHGNQQVAESKYKEYKKLRNKINNEIKQTKKKYYKEDMEKTRKVDPAKFWKITDHTSGRNATYSEPITLIRDETTLDDPEEIAEEFNEYFDSKIKKIREELPKFPPREYERKVNKDCFSFEEVEREEVLEHIKSLSSSQAFGHDNISNKLIKAAKHKIAPVMAAIANNCIQSNYFPSCWKLGKIQALHKKGPKTVAENYRPITLLCSLSKLLEKIMFKQIYEHFETNGLFDPDQYGFRKGLSTSLAVLDYTNRVLRARDGAEAKKINSIFLDLSAAFDLVAHGQLLRKLDAYGFDKKARDLLESYLTGRTVYVEVELGASKVKEIAKCGVPQGSILGPLLYLIFITNISEIKDPGKVIYADDTSAMVLADSMEELVEKSNEAMRTLVNFYSEAELKLNPKKTEIINHNCKTSKLRIITNPATGETTESTYDARLLGIQVDNDLTFKRHIDTVLRDLDLRLKVFRRITKLASMEARRVYGLGILISKISYGLACVSGTTQQQLSRLETAYNECTRAIYGVSKVERVPLQVMREQLNLLSFQSLVKYTDITMFAKILNTKQPKNLSKYILRSNRAPRGFSEGDCRINFIPKSEKMKRFFLFRACESFNSLPPVFKKDYPLTFNKMIRSFLFKMENPKKD